MHLKIGVNPEAKNYMPFNLDTGKWIHDCFEVDDETGEYWIYNRDEHGRFFMKDGDLAREKRRARIVLRPAGEYEAGKEV